MGLISRNVDSKIQIKISFAEEREGAGGTGWRGSNVVSIIFVFNHKAKSEQQKLIQSVVEKFGLTQYNNFS